MCLNVVGPNWEHMNYALAIFSHNLNWKPYGQEIST